MFYFICIVFMELWGPKSKQNYKIENAWIMRDLNMQPFKSQSGTIDKSATLTSGKNCGL